MFGLEVLFLFRIDPHVYRMLLLQDAEYFEMHQCRYVDDFHSFDVI